MKKPVYRAFGALSVALGLIGVFLPIMPTTPFLILAAYFFGRSHPEWEEKLLAHPTFGPLIIAWRERGAIPLLAKWLATAMLGVSSTGSWLYLSGGWRYLPAVISAVVLAWMWSRPSR